MADIDMTNPLYQELMRIEGLHGQNPETGAGSNNSYLSEYTNRLFGAPFQFLDSVDKRFPNINSHLGNEYLRNFILNSPILHIKPGMPKYTGGDEHSADSLKSQIKSMYMDTNIGGMDLVDTLLGSLAQSLIFGSGSKLQRRMFGFRETYYDYMQHVNYMCRSVAIFMNLTTGENFPSGTFCSTGFSEFIDMRWENYRMMANSVTKKPWEYFAQMVQVPTATAEAIAKTIGVGATSYITQYLNPTSNTMEDYINNMQAGNNIIEEAWEKSKEHSFANTLVNKISSVQFMVEPVDFSETLSNVTESSIIESSIDAIQRNVGTELAFITGSRADIGIIDNLFKALGDTAESAVTQVSSIVSNVSGGFLHNVFTGAIQSIKGQKMIYPEIYKESKSTMNYEFDITLTTPYGDAYNYYMNILVPLMHLIALASPRMVTSNTTTSPYLVQAYIPGMCTCQLGIIENMSIQKNPKGNHVSVNGFPLTVKVHFTIKELYNALSISPANDPASFLFNETLNDYMANLAGLIPSVDTYTAQRKSMFTNLANYFSSYEWVNDILDPINEKIENAINPFY